MLQLPQSPDRQNLGLDDNWYWAMTVMGMIRRKTCITSRCMLIVRVIKGVYGFQVIQQDRWTHSCIALCVLALEACFLSSTIILAGLIDRDELTTLHSCLRNGRKH
jgi:hypothetical protein